ncbi:MAG: beta-ketoacyl synthase chain length factor [Deferribacteraceae bacterium]|jgi:hypothetical protein|nr:beta-ketoacyl synthase chain length factor [Deferribacteraceae bacterium]
MFAFSLLNYSAFAPSLYKKDDWNRWIDYKKQTGDNIADAPPVDFMPPMLRRRLSQNIKIAVYAAYNASAGYKDLRTVFASRYGEWQQTFKHLLNYYNENSVSPAGFSLSVHNAAAGLFSLITGNKSPYTSISATDYTFSAGLLETFMQLETNNTVLYVYSDESAPDFYKDRIKSFLPCSVALLLSKYQPGELKSFSCSYRDNNVEDDPFAFIRFILEDQKSFQCKKFDINLL